MAGDVAAPIDLVNTRLPQMFNFKKSAQYLCSATKWAIDATFQNIISFYRLYPFVIQYAIDMNVRNYHYGHFGAMFTDSHGLDLMFRAMC